MVDEQRKKRAITESDEARIKFIEAKEHVDKLIIQLEIMKDQMGKAVYLKKESE